MSKSLIIMEDYDDLIEEESDTAIKYPCAVISGLLTVAEMQMLKEKVDTYSETLFDEFGEEVTTTTESCPLYVDFDGILKEVGNFFFSLDYILHLNYVGQYSLTLMRDSDNSRAIDMKNGFDLLNFISL